jgi:hypothetical protein
MQSFEIINTEKRGSVKNQQLFRFRKINDCSSHRRQCGGWMSLLLQPILRGPRRRRMGPLRCLLNVGTRTLSRCRGRNLCVWALLFKIIVRNRLVSLKLTNKTVHRVSFTVCYNIFLICPFFFFFIFYCKIAVVFWILSFLCRGITSMYITV